mmetsp:Transcript_3166/g.10224  ORF Transcript_3166/g.10224 Transcript_3166/m.10224 type:complete len:259 (+) Transcript_3166:67-843(+)
MPCSEQQLLRHCFPCDLHTVVLDVEGHDEPQRFRRHLAASLINPVPEEAHPIRSFVQQQPHHIRAHDMVKLDLCFTAGVERGDAPAQRASRTAQSAIVCVHVRMLPRLDVRAHQTLVGHSDPDFITNQVHLELEVVHSRPNRLFCHHRNHVRRTAECNRGAVIASVQLAFVRVPFVVPLRHARGALQQRVVTKAVDDVLEGRVILRIRQRRRHRVARQDVPLRSQPLYERHHHVRGVVEERVALLITGNGLLPAAGEH